MASIDGHELPGDVSLTTGGDVAEIESLLLQGFLPGRFDISCRPRTPGETEALLRLMNLIAFRAGPTTASAISHPELERLGVTAAILIAVGVRNASIRFSFCEALRTVR